MRRRSRAAGRAVRALATVAGGVGLLTACSSAEPVPEIPVVTAGDQVAGTTGVPAIRLTEEAEAEFVLYVSNQSFAHGTVRIEVAIDGVELVDRDFAVEGQHNWIAFPVSLPPGGHTLTARSDTGAVTERTFDVPEGQRRWAVLDYWYHPEGEPRMFTWNLSDEPIRFA